MALLIAFAGFAALPFIGPKLYELSQDKAWLLIGGVIFIGIVLGAAGFEPGVSSDEYLH